MCPLLRPLIYRCNGESQHSRLARRGASGARRRTRLLLFYILIAYVALLMIPKALAAKDFPADQIPKWTVLELRFQSSSKHNHPFKEVWLELLFRSPSGKEQWVDGFWDGGNSWKVRFSPDEEGTWQYKVVSSPVSETAWKDKSGTFHCISYSGANPLYTRGALRVSANRRYLEQADGTPFFWLSDTAWNGPLKADPKSWAEYLRDRQEKGFTAVQFVATQWLAAASDRTGNVAYSTDGGFSIHPEFFRNMEERVAEINDHGMFAAAVLVWDVNPGVYSAALVPGSSLSTADLIALVKYQIARFGAFQVVWILAGDGDYRAENEERWLTVGQNVFGKGQKRLVTLHPAGLQWIPAEVAAEPWFDFVSYQSGHGDSASDLRWLTSGPPSRNWEYPPVHPIINLEPNYEGHLSFQGRNAFDAHAVRRAGYWSLLNSPVAGVAYGAHGIWSWEIAPNIPMNHDNTGIAPPWNTALHLPGSADMRHLRDLFAGLHWWTLRPATDLFYEQPGERDPSQFVLAARSEEEGWAIVYLPVGQSIRLRYEAFRASSVVRWFDPRTGAWSEPRALESSAEISAPDTNDWVAWIGKASPTAEPE